MTADVEHRWVDTDHGLAEVLDALAHEPRYALDTEFHRERTYYPKLALVQIAWPGDLVLVDPLEVDITALARLFARDDAVAVLHAAQQDLDVLTHAVGAVPEVLFDTQIAGGFLGYGTPSLVSLLQGELKVSPGKGDRLTDWLHRPLTPAQRNYAAGDVAWLLELHDTLTEQLDALGRSEWAAQACRELLAKPVSGADPDTAWLRLKDSRSLRPTGRAVARAVAAWRERRAMSIDVPPRQVLPDLAILGISQKQPKNAKELSQARGVDGRLGNGKLVDEVLEAVRSARDVEPPPAPRGNDDLDRDLRPAVTLVSAWVGQVARHERIDTAMLATRADLVALLRGDDDARLASGWRAEILGDDIRALVGGTAGLTFDGKGGLRLVEVGQPD